MRDSHPREWYARYSSAERKQLLEKALALIKNLGIKVGKYNDCPSWSKQPQRGIKLYEGALYIDIQTAHIGEVLHEAGHILSVPKEARVGMTGWIKFAPGQGEQIAQVIALELAEILEIEPWIVESVL